MKTEWTWTEEQTTCLTLMLSVKHLDGIIQDLSYLGLEGLSGIADALFRAKVALQNMIDNNYEECNC